MNKQTIDKMWAVSLLVISISGLILNGSNILSISLPDSVVRVFGGLCIVCIPIVVYTTIMKFRNKNSK